MTEQKTAEQLSEHQKARRLKQGRDYHGWAWKCYDFWGKKNELFYWAEPYKPSRKEQPTETGSGKWVRVKFVEVKTK